MVTAAVWTGWLCLYCTGALEPGPDRVWRCPCCAPRWERLRSVAEWEAFAEIEHAVLVLERAR